LLSVPGEQLLQRYLPRYQFAERHAALIAAPPAAVLDAVSCLERDADPLVRFFIRLRELPARCLGRKLDGQPAFGMHCFTRLERLGNVELAYGLAGEFWRAAYGLQPLADAAAFLALEQSTLPRLLLHFSTEPVGEQTRLHTETRVYCPGKVSLLKFAPYWYLIRPVSGLIRQRMLRSIRLALAASPD